MSSAMCNKCGGIGEVMDLDIYGYETIKPCQCVSGELRLPKPTPYLRDPMPDDRIDAYRAFKDLIES